MEKEIERFGEKEITCPYCGYTYTDSWESGLDKDGDSQIEECEECGRKFQVSMNIDVSYTSRGLCKENNIEHNWEEFDFISTEDGHRCKGRECLTCDEYEFDETKEEKKENDK